MTAYHHSDTIPVMTLMAVQPTSRMIRMRRICGYGTVIAVMPYMLIKIAWTFGLFLPTEEMGEADWRAINATTAVLAAVGILLATAFVRPWGERLPAWLIVIPVWVGTGLLVPMLLLAPVLGPAAMSRDEQAEASTDLWAYEQTFVMISLVGVGIGLPLALAGYARARWPEALSGPADPGRPRGTPWRCRPPCPGCSRPAVSRSASSRCSGRRAAKRDSTRAACPTVTCGGICCR